MDKQDLLKIINHFGLERQLIKLSEEVAELQQAILLDDGSEEALEHIIEEYGDVENVLEQFRFYKELDYTKVVYGRINKIKRTLKKIEEEK